MSGVRCRADRGQRGREDLTDARRAPENWPTWGVTQKPGDFRTPLEPSSQTGLNPKSRNSREKSREEISGNRGPEQKRSLSRPATIARDMPPQSPRRLADSFGCARPTRVAASRMASPANPRVTQRHVNGLWRGAARQSR